MDQPRGTRSPRASQACTSMPRRRRPASRSRGGLPESTILLTTMEWSPSAKRAPRSALIRNFACGETGRAPVAFRAKPRRACGQGVTFGLNLSLILWPPGNTAKTLTCGQESRRPRRDSAIRSRERDRRPGRVGGLRMEAGEAPWTRKLLSKRSCPAGT